MEIPINVRKILESHNFVKVGVLKYYINADDFEKDAIIEWLETDLLQNNDINYVLLGDDKDILYVGESTKTIQKRASRYYTLCTGKYSWKQNYSDFFERWFPIVSKYKNIFIYVRPAEKIECEFGSYISTRKMVEMDMIESFKPPLNVRDNNNG